MRKRGIWVFLLLFRVADAADLRSFEIWSTVGAEAGSPRELRYSRWNRRATVPWSDSSTAVLATSFSKTNRTKGDLHNTTTYCSDVGGGFGLKAHVFGEDAVTAFLSWRLRLPVKWIEDRREHLSASLHAKHQIVSAELALKKDGTISGMRGRFVSDVGAYSDFPWGSRIRSGACCVVNARSI